MRARPVFGHRAIPPIMRRPEWDIQAMRRVLDRFDGASRIDSSRRVQRFLTEAIPEPFWTQYTHGVGGADQFHGAACSRVHGRTKCRCCCFDGGGRPDALHASVEAQLSGFADRRNTQIDVIPSASARTITSALTIIAGLFLAVLIGKGIAATYYPDYGP